MCLLVGPRIPGPADMSSVSRSSPPARYVYIFSRSLFTSCFWCLLFTCHDYVFVVRYSFSTCTCPSRVFCSPFSHDTNLPTIVPTTHCSGNYILPTFFASPGPHCHGSVREMACPLATLLPARSYPVG